jgi:predicted AAA+ superfamily ATPase
VSRAISKEKKLYLFDSNTIRSEPAKFENMVAIELFRAVSYWNDSGQGNFSLNYVRNREKQEVDFLVTRDDAPFLLIEAKMSDSDVSRSLKYFQTLFAIPAVQLLNRNGTCKIVRNGEQTILVTDAARWLGALPG